MHLPFRAFIAEEDGDEYVNNANGEEEIELQSDLDGWRQALEAPFDQIEKYDLYVRGVSQFDTHQGVKGLEFSRVMVVTTSPRIQ